MDKLLRYWLCTMLLMFVFQLTYAEAQIADSLLLNFYKENNDTSKIGILFKVSDYYRNVEHNHNLADNYILEAKKSAENTQKDGLIAFVYNYIGTYYRNNASYSEALTYHYDALQISKKINDSSQIANTYNNLGVVYRLLDNHALAVENHVEALRIAEHCADTSNISVACNSLGNVFLLNGRPDEAILYFKRALDLSIKENNKLGIAINYNNIGEAYEFKGDYNKARELYTKSLNINKEIKSDQGTSISYNCLGKIGLYEGNAHLAHNYFKAAIDIDKRLNSKRYLADGYCNLAKASLALKKYDEAKSSIDKGLAIADEINSLLHKQMSYENLSDYYKALENYMLAYDYIKLSNSYKDSILNEKSTRTIASMQVLYESEKRESEIKILKQEQEITDQLYAKQQTRSYILLCGIVLLLGIIVVIYIALHGNAKRNKLLSSQIREIERKNAKLAEQKEEITSQKEDIIRKKEIIEIKNDNLEKAYRTIENYVYNITESIRYAEKIQESIQPSTALVKDIFSDTVVFNKPKDIVSGDFNWLYSTPEKVFFALSDCTGHGVPGAFMSIIGIDLLNQAIRQNKCLDSEQMLSFVNAQLIKRFRKSENDRILMDSMDIAICVYDRNTQELSFSGALIPIIIIRNGEIYEMKPNSYSLGSIFRSDPVSFKTMKFQLYPNDWVYISSDGFYDQIGGPEKRKYQRSKFKEFVSSISKISGEEQQLLLDSEFKKWMGTNEQIDDVLVWGIKI